MTLRSRCPSTGESLLAVVALVLLTGPNPTHGQPADPAAELRGAVPLGAVSRSFEELADRVLPGVVQVFATGDAPAEPASGSGSLLQPFATIGSGVVVSRDGLILTNAHVIRNATRVQVLFSRSVPDSGEPFRSILKPMGERTGARIVGLDDETDLAVLRVDVADVPHLEFGDSDELRPGQLVFAFGSPQGLMNSVSMGVVSNVARQPAPEHPMVYVQTDATINPGSSGGPLVDANGHVVGINTWILSRSGGSEGIAFAIPANIAQAIYEQIRETGRVTRGEIGVHAQTITPRLATGLGLDRTWGVLVGDVRPEGPAERAGIRRGDIVLALNGKRMENGRQLDVNVYRFRPGSRVTLEIERDGERTFFDVEVTARDDERARLAQLVTRDRNFLPELGVLAVALSPEVRRLLPPLRYRTGLLVAGRTGSVSLEGEELSAGDVIHRIENREVESLEDARAVLSSRPAGSLVALQVERNRILRYLVVERRDSSP